ncbi:hypothetical protein DDZ18_10250 [Marinicauda salina]|jgi:hypothetical protein|uniref:Uncharacterized protein n=1 Tax=Marinicauda salina TaxID=2135793 RepID=A0A2U2BST5_9PROT|nr:hypothetical protein [Marinicauda salina]PWE17073.1 hypothetical protein DDZ18_10250 [Marinicauda salina]
MLRLLIDVLHAIAAGAFSLLGLDYAGDDCSAAAVQPVRQYEIHQLTWTEDGEATAEFFIRDGGAESAPRASLRTLSDCGGGGDRSAAARSSSI